MSVWPAMYRRMGPRFLCLASASAMRACDVSSLGASLAAMAAESVAKLTSSCGMWTDQGYSDTEA